MYMNAFIFCQSRTPSIYLMTLKGATLKQSSDFSTTNFCFEKTMPNLITNDVFIIAVEPLRSLERD